MDFKIEILNNIRNLNNKILTSNDKKISSILQIILRHSLLIIIHNTQANQKINKICLFLVIYSIRTKIISKIILINKLTILLKDLITIKEIK